jgi:hypothetical protein
MQVFSKTGPIDDNPLVSEHPKDSHIPPAFVCCRKSPDIMAEEVVSLPYSNGGFSMAIIYRYDGRERWIIGQGGRGRTSMFPKGDRDEGIGGILDIHKRG